LHTSVISAFNVIVTEHCVKLDSSLAISCILYQQTTTCSIHDRRQKMHLMSASARDYQFQQ